MENNLKELKECGDTDTRNKLLSECSTILNCCDEDVQKCSVVEEQSYRYAIIRTYCKILLSCKEILCLLLNGFPDGGMALTRQVFEGWVIVRALLIGIQQNDCGLIERFFDSIVIFELKQSKRILEYVISQKVDQKETQEKLDNVESQAMAYLTKYNKEKLRDFKDYWWAECDSFQNLKTKVHLPDDYMYSFTSNRVHLNIASMFNYMDQTEEGILLGPSISGWKMPLQYMLICLRSIVGEISAFYPEFTSPATIKKITDLAEKLRGCL